MSSYPNGMWPYDELMLSQGPSDHEFVVQTPWVTLSLKTDSSTAARLKPLAEKMEQQTLSLEDRNEWNWFLQSLAHYPLAYLLPRPSGQFDEAADRPFLSKSEQFSRESPEAFCQSALKAFGVASAEAILGGNLSPREWNWDVEAALQFSQNEEGYDPGSLFSVARRYSLVGSSKSETRVLFDIVTALRNDPQRYRQACAQIVRQNHFVTQRCQASLLPALRTAGHARPQVEEFIRSEMGHDKLLERALQDLCGEAPFPEVVPAAGVLMQLLEGSAGRNFLAFAMVVDIFERSSYTERDPLAALLDAGGYAYSAQQIDIHKGINDTGAHENVALEFLKPMGPVSQEYAREALGYAELASHMVQTVSRQLAVLVAQGH